MVKKLLINTIIIFFMFTGISIAKDKIYTSYNIWIHNNMKTINFKMGDNFIPVGTELKYISIEEDDRSNKWIQIKLLNTKSTYQIVFTGRYHKGKKMRDYRNYIKTNKTFDEMTKSMSELEINAIKKGKIVVDMSKEAVLLSYGRPPEHRTPDLKSNKWRYWMNKRIWKFIYFYNNKTVTQSDYEKLKNAL